MKRWIYILGWFIALSLVPGLASAIDREGDQVIQIIPINAADASGNGTAAYVGIQKKGKYTVMVDTTGSPTAVTVEVLGSLTESGNYSVLATHAFTASEITNGYAMFHIVDKPVQWVNSNLATLTGGSSPTVTVTVLSE